MGRRTDCKGEQEMNRSSLVTGEGIEEMRKRHEKEIAFLQKHCKHDVVEWMEYHPMLAHRQGEVRICLNCGKHLEYR